MGEQCASARAAAAPPLLPPYAAMGWANCGQQGQQEREAEWWKEVGRRGGGGMAKEMVYLLQYQAGQQGWEDFQYSNFTADLK